MRIREWRYGRDIAGAARQRRFAGLQDVERCLQPQRNRFEPFRDRRRAHSEEDVTYGTPNQ